MMNLTCNEGCSKDFILIKYGTEKVQKGIERVGFSCPHCGHVYTAYYQNKNIKNWNERLANLIEHSNKKIINEKQLARNNESIKKYKIKIQDEMNRLRNLVESG